MMKPKGYFLCGRGKSSKELGHSDERIRKVCLIYELYGQNGGMKDLKFWGASPCISGRGVGVN